MTTEIHLGLFQAESWEEWKKLLLAMTKGLTGKEPDFPDS